MTATGDHSVAIGRFPLRWRRHSCVALSEARWWMVRSQAPSCAFRKVERGRRAGQCEYA